MKLVCVGALAWLSSKGKLDRNLGKIGPIGGILAETFFEYWSERLASIEHALRIVFILSSPSHLLDRVGKSADKFILLPETRFLVYFNEQGGRIDPVPNTVFELPRMRGEDEYEPE